VGHPSMIRANLNYLLSSALFALAAGAVIAAGLPYTLKYYRGQFSVREKKATFAAACTVTLVTLAMFDIRHLIPGEAGEVATIIAMVLTSAVGIVCASVALFGKSSP
jgi:hypothetical protein